MACSLLGNTLIYNSRNCYGLIAPSAPTARWSYLQQQKLLWPYSLEHVGRECTASTIVEIVMALQPASYPHSRAEYLQQQKLLWLYSPPVGMVNVQHLQQQKLLWLYSRSRAIRWYVEIYNSRNCYGFIARSCDYPSHEIYNSRNCYGFIAKMPFLQLCEVHLQQQKLLWLYSPTSSKTTFQISTIVEIVMALQPQMSWSTPVNYLQQQKLLWLYSRRRRSCDKRVDLQQQKLLWLYSLTRRSITTYSRSTIVEIVMALQPMRKQFFNPIIYNSRNCYGFIATYYDANI